jgi:hypothetical protein
LVDGGVEIGFARYYALTTADYDYFPMSRKRNYLNNAARSADSLRLLLADEQFALGLLHLRFGMTREEGEDGCVTEADLPAKLADLFDKHIVKLISANAAAAYEGAGIDIDKSTNRNEELQFTNRHAILILAWSSACAAAVPVITALLDARDVPPKETPNLIMNCFGALLRQFEPADNFAPADLTEERFYEHASAADAEAYDAAADALLGGGAALAPDADLMDAWRRAGPAGRELAQRRLEGRAAADATDVLAKIRKMVESRVLQTRYSDKVMWHYLQNVAVDPGIFIDKLFKKFIVDIIPKMQPDKSIIGITHTVIQHQIKYQFTAKFGMTFKPVRPDLMDTDGVSAMEHLETELVRRDEGQAVLADIAAIQAIRDAALQVGAPLGAAEVDHWAAQLKEHGVNPWQHQIVTLYFLPRVRRVEYIRTRTLREYAQMLLVARRWAAQTDLPLIADYLGTRVVAGADGRRLLQRKKFVREFMDSIQYRELLGSSFELATQSIIDSGVVIDLISVVYSNSFQRLPELGREPPAEGTERVDERIEAIAQEVLRFIAHVARPVADF